MMNSRNQNTTDNTTFFNGHECTQIRKGTTQGGIPKIIRFGLPILTGALMLAVVVMGLLLPKFKHSTNFDKRQKAYNPTEQTTKSLLSAAGDRSKQTALPTKQKPTVKKVAAKQLNAGAKQTKIRPTTTATLLNVENKVVEQQKSELAKNEAKKAQAETTQPVVTEAVTKPAIEPTEAESKPTGKAEVDVEKPDSNDAVAEDKNTDTADKDEKNPFATPDFGPVEITNTEETNVTKYVQTNLNLRDGYTFDDDIITVLNPGTELKEYKVITVRTRAGVIEEWSYVTTVDGEEGYVYTAFLGESAPEVKEEKQPEQDQVASQFEELSGTLYVNSSDGAYMRVDSSSSSKGMVILYYGQEVELLGKGTNDQGEVWYKVSKDGEVGFVRSDLLQEEKIDLSNQVAPDKEDASRTEVIDPVSEASVSVGTGSSIASMGLQYVGDNYVYGGQNPGGFDCSGFVYYLYKSHGISVPRTADAQATVGDSIPFAPGDYSNLVPGDIVTFADAGYGVGHSGIYIGDNSFVHASTEGVGVIVSRLDSDYYLNRLYSVRRVVY